MVFGHGPSLILRSYRPSGSAAVNPFRRRGGAAIIDSKKTKYRPKIGKKIGRRPMLFHHCPACDSTGSSRRQFLAGLGAVGLGAAGLAAALPAPAVHAQGAKTL